MIVCPECEKFIRWAKSHKNEGQRDGKIKADYVGISFCQLCLRPTSMLGRLETLDVHHVDENPLNDKRDNLWVLCTMCHKYVHHVRTYLYEHFKDEEI